MPINIFYLTKKATDVAFFCYKYLLYKLNLRNAIVKQKISEIISNLFNYI